MRITSRLLAKVARTPSNYLTPGAPTGLTGVITHPHPRPALLWLYTATLNKLEKLPPTSVYRTSTEALTRHRLNIVASVEPAGFEEWQRKVADEYVPLLQKLDKEAKASREASASSEKSDTQGTGKRWLKPTGIPDSVRQIELKGKPYTYQIPRINMVDERDIDWDGEPGSEDNVGEGVRSEEMRTKQLERVDRLDERMHARSDVELENEPELTSEQISDLEQKIGSGLIEEVIDVAQCEYDLVDTMVQAKVWEELEEKPAEGQWTYFERGN